MVRRHWVWAAAMAIWASWAVPAPVGAQTDQKPTDLHPSDVQPPEAQSPDAKPSDSQPSESNSSEPNSSEPNSSDSRLSDPKQISLDDIRAIITGLGYDLQPNPYPEIKITNDKGVFFIGFSLSQNNTIVSDYIILHTIPADKLKTMPMCRILYFNDTHTSYFSLNNKGADKRIIINSQLTAGAASPKAIHAMIEAIVADTVGSDKLWNPDLWSDTTFPDDCAPPDP